MFRVLLSLGGEVGREVGGEFGAEDEFSEWLSLMPSTRITIQRFLVLTRDFVLGGSVDGMTTTARRTQQSQCRKHCAMVWFGRYRNNHQRCRSPFVVGLRVLLQVLALDRVRVLLRVWQVACNRHLPGKFAPLHTACSRRGHLHSLQCCKSGCSDKVSLLGARRCRVRRFH